MPELSQNSELAFSRENELVRNAKTHLAPVWKCFHQAMLAVDRLQRELIHAAAETGFAIPGTVQKRHEANRRAYKESFRFFDEGDDDLKRMIARVIEQSGKCEVYQKSSDLLEVARAVKALTSKIADIEPAGGKEKRAEGAALGRYLGIRNGRTFRVLIHGTDKGITFEAIGSGKGRRYKFTEVAE